jgi:hypothetical protein
LTHFPTRLWTRHRKSTKNFAPGWESGAAWVEFFSCESRLCLLSFPHFFLLSSSELLLSEMMENMKKKKRKTRDREQTESWNGEEEAGGCRKHFCTGLENRCGFLLCTLPCGAVAEQKFAASVSESGAAEAFNSTPVWETGVGHFYKKISPLVGLVDF